MKREHIDILIDQHLNSEKERVVELFKSDEIFDELNRNSKFDDWLHFESKTNDGDYLIKDGKWYAVYFQERGRIVSYERYETLQKAATCFFKGVGYIENT